MLQCLFKLCPTVCGYGSLPGSERQLVPVHKRKFDELTLEKHFAGNELYPLLCSVVYYKNTQSYPDAQAELRPARHWT